MAFSSIGRIDLGNQLDMQNSGMEASGGRPAHHDADRAPVVDLQEQINNAAEEMADVLSVFGRFSRSGRKSDSLDNDFLSAMLEEKADEKCDILIRQVAKMSLNNNELLKYARNLFPNDSDLMLALRELMLSRKLSALQKQNVKAAMAELAKFADTPCMQSGINVGRLAKRFAGTLAGTEGGGAHSLSASQLRASYLRFLSLDLPGCFLYQDWIDEHGCDNRQRLLAFTLNALVTDMKASEPGIHCEEFGPLCSKLSEARVIHSLDMALNERFAAFPFRAQLKYAQTALGEEDIVALYMAGLLEEDAFPPLLKQFNNHFMARLLVKQRAAVVQALRNIFNLTPESLYANSVLRPRLLDFIASLLTSFYEKERRVGIWSEYYQ